MYDTMIKDVQEQMKPVTDMAEISKQTTEKLVALQSAFVTEYFNSAIAQFKALAAVKEPMQIIELQMQYMKDLESKATNTAEQEIAALSEAKEQYSEIVEKSISSMAEAPYFTEMKNMMAKMPSVEMAPYFTEMNKMMANMPGVEMPVAAPAAKAEEPAPAAKPSRRKTAA